VESLDEGLSEAIRRGAWREAPGLSDADSAMLTYVETLTKTPARIQKEDLDVLRAHGFDDRGILQINLIASWFNYINRVADGLGVGRGE
jgi:alkylhydroperoxidase family enzyme